MVSPSGVAVLAYKNAVELYDITGEAPFALKTRWEIGLSHQNGILTISNDGKYLAASDYESNITVLDLSTGRVAFSKRSAFLFFGLHSGMVNYLRFSADGRYLVSADHKGQVFVHNLQGELTHKHRLDHPLLFAPVSSDGKLLACTRTVILHQENLPHVVCLPESVPVNIQFTQSGTTRFSLRDLIEKFSLEKFLRSPFIESVNGNELIIHKNAAEKIPRRISLKSLGLLHDKSVSARSVDGEYVVLRQSVPPDDGWAVAYKFYSIRLRDSEIDLLGTHRIGLTTGGFTPMSKGEYGYSLLSTVSILKPDGVQRNTCEAGSGDNMFYSYLEYSPKGDFLIGIYANRIILWDKAGKRIAESGETARFTEIRMSATDDLFLTSSDDGTATIWRTVDLTKIATYLQTATGWVVAASDGRFEHRGDALKLLHYAANGEIVPIESFDKSFESRNLLAAILSGQRTKPMVSQADKPGNPPEIRKSLKGKIHSVSAGEVLLGGSGFLMGETVFSIVSGRPVRMKVHFPTHTGAKAKPVKLAELGMLKAGMPVFR